MKNGCGQITTSYTCDPMSVESLSVFAIRKDLTSLLNYRDQLVARLFKIYVID